MPVPRDMFAFEPTLAEDMDGSGLLPEGPLGQHEPWCRSGKR